MQVERAGHSNRMGPAEVMLVLLSAEEWLKALSEASIRSTGYSKLQLRVLSDLFQKESPFCIFHPQFPKNMKLKS